MKAYQIALVTGLVAVLFLTGCSNTSDKQDTGVNQIQQVAPNESGQKLQIGLYGKVKKIVGNSITIALAEPPKGVNRSGQGRSGNAAQGIEAPPAGAPVPGSEGPPPNFAQGGPPDSGNANRDSGRNSTRGMNFGLSASNLKLTGEVKEVMIPVGVPIESLGGKDAKTIDFADIDVGNVITIFYLEGTEQIQRVLISADSSGN